MSKKEKVTEQKEEKVMTKYDLKMQKRAEEKEKERREKLIGTITSVVIVVALVCLVASFPIRTYMAVHQTFVKINGENISKVEFDYNYNVVKNNYMNQYGSYLAYFGLNTAGDLSTQMYSDTLTWQDYFEQETIDSIIREKALKAQAEAAGFTYDTDEEYQSFKDDVKEAAAQGGISDREFLQQMYGSYATLGRIEEYVREGLYVNAYFSQISDEKTPSDSEIQSYYEENKNDYDSVDYYLTLIQAELPTEPTELADPAVEDADETEGAAYQPSEAEIEKAMTDAKKLADAAEDKITSDGELRENASYLGTSYLIRDWLFDESRREGDTTIIEDASGRQYYVLSFVKRYLDETPSADVRIISTEAGNAQAILDEWKNGEATEESFGQLADKYNEGTSFTAEGGYYEEVTENGTQEVLAAWMFDQSRAAGDTTAIDTEEGYSFVLYYVGQNDPEWKLTIRSEVLNDIMEAYLQEISEGIEVEDSKGNLNYLKVQAAEEAAGDSEEGEGSAESTDEADTLDDTEE